LALPALERVLRTTIPFWNRRGKCAALKTALTVARKTI